MCFQRLSKRIKGESRPPKPGWKVIPQSRTGSRETPVAKFVVCSWHDQLPDVVGMRPQRATTSIREKMTVVSEIRGSSTSERLTHEPRDVKCDSLTNWQPVQLPQHWFDVVTMTGACDQTSGNVFISHMTTTTTFANQRKLQKMARENLSIGAFYNITKNQCHYTVARVHNGNW